MEIERTVLTTVTLPKPLVKKIDRLVSRGFFPNRCEAVRYAVEKLLEKYGGPLE
ncbi:type II toxin-antitoxin system ParD family antitoxin [Pyrobaculum aerophilum]|uniref:ribbon-helix-helix domain-containing protein n=1 Tax=Pyrobaculum aerophilum TaxID=13773 RepID=UPI002FDA4989